MPKKHGPIPWEIAPLAGKYYGTYILDADGAEVCRIWDHNHDDAGDNRPSVREVAKYGPLDSDEFKEFWREYCCDSHYENVRDYANAELIVTAVNTLTRS